MNSLPFILILVFAFGTLASIGFLVLWLNEFQSHRMQWFGPVGAFALAFCAFWFLVNLAVTASELAPASRTVPALATVKLLATAMSFAFAPLMMHVYYSDQISGPAADPLWRLPIAAAYVTSVSLAAGTLLTIARLGRDSAALVLKIFGVGEFILFTIAILFCAIAFVRLRTEAETPNQRKYREWNLFLLLLTVFVILPSFLGFSSFADRSEAAYAPKMARAFPLCFLFVAAYTQRRFAFFDIFVKRGAYLVLSFVLLGVFLTFALQVSSGSPIQPVVTSLALLPLLLTAPWSYRVLGRWLDRVYLRRRFAPAEAMKYFLDGALGAVTEAQLVAECERRLSTIFSAEATIAWTLPAPLPRPEEVAYEIPIRVGERISGLISLGKRHDDQPYFLEDTRLLASLAQVFSSLLHGLHLQREGEEHERREERLRFEATRSQLRSLRAQVNPHFLFNALNTIADRISEDPGRAEEMVERLAEVFRYTLTRSDEEWVSVAEEIEFLRSYLEIEQARFGGELDVRIDMDPAAADARIPTMAIQILVENALKHGVGAIRGRGLLEIRVTRRTDSLRVDVMDNGPGFSAAEPIGRWPARELATDSTGDQGARGYGLANLAGRLRGYFADGASLTARRDDANGLTIVCVELPTAGAVGQAARGGHDPNPAGR